METRKVQVTGGSTFTVSLPKEWARDNDVESGTRVALYAEGDTLVVSPRTEAGEAERTIDSAGREDDEITRAILTAYVSGYDRIRLRTSDDKGRRRAVRRATDQLLGVEVVEQTADEVVVQDLLDPGEFSIEKALTRIRLISLSMLEDAIQALVEDDDDLARGVVQRDDDVDRLWFVVSRSFRSTLRDPAAVTELGLDRESCFELHTAARQLERVADHATKIATLALDFEGQPEIQEPLVTMQEDAETVIDTAMDAVLTDDRDEARRLATRARQQVRVVEDDARDVDEQLRGMDAEQAQVLGLVVDSLSRCGDYGGNVAETALQKASPRP